MRLFVIGAGASIDHTDGLLPGSVGFLARAVDTAAENAELATHRAALQEAVRRFYDFDAFGSSARAKLKRVDVEELLTLSSLQRELEPQFAPERLLSDLIVRTVLNCQEALGEVTSTYHRFVSLLGPEDSVLSFNWDSLLDPLIPGYKPYGGSAGDGMFRNYQRFCTSEWEKTYGGFGFQEPYSSLQDSLTGREKGTAEGRAYIKLHGSVDLVNCVNSGCRQHGKPFRTASPLVANFCGECNEPLAPFIVPPIQAKPIRQSPYVRRAWSVAALLSSEADELVFWGYSLPTTDFWANWLIRRAWFGRCKKICIINPSAYFKKQGGFSKAFVQRFAPVALFRSRHAVTVSRDFSDYEKGKVEQVAQAS